MRWVVCLVVVCIGASWTLPVSGAVPSSLRARKAIKQVKPKLVASLRRKGLRWGAPIFIRIFKKTKELEVWVKKKRTFVLFRTYSICYFSGLLGPKTKQGDSQAPEGFYFVKAKQMNPWSRYHLAFNIGYPNRFDRAHRRTGSLIMVHGRCVSIGCFAMTNPRIKQIYALADAALRGGQRFFRVHIFPFRMTKQHMKRYRTHRWYSFWKMLRKGYLWFERRRIPPNTLVRRGKYVFR